MNFAEYRNADGDIELNRARGGMSGRVGIPALRRGRTHPPQAVPPPFQGGFLGA